MSNIEKLLEDVTVEWKPISKSLVRTQGTSITASQMKVLHKENAPLKIFAGGKTVAFVNFDDIPYKDINREPSIIVKSRGIIEFEYYDKPFTHKKEMWSYHSRNEYINIKFVYYFLKINEPYFQNIGNRMQMPQISTPDTDKFLIPIPCPNNPNKSIAIQNEIVRILDKFSTLTAELQAELQAELYSRKSQYEYYRNQLLTYPMEESDQLEHSESCSATSIQNSGNPTQPLSVSNPHSGNSVLQSRGKVEWKMLGEIAEYSHKRINAATMRKTNYVGVDNLLQNKAGKIESNYVPTEGNLTAYTVGDILIGNIRPYLKKIWLADNNGGTNGDVLVIHLTDQSVDMRYLYQVLADDNFFVYNMQHAKGAKMPRGNKQKIMEYSIPIPPIEEQKHIVSILDKFDTLINSITEGLPKEIELRQKQYEYYRDMLLSFPKNNIKA